MVGEVERPLRGGGPNPEKGSRRGSNSFSKSFSYFVFNTKFKCKPNQIQIEFKIHFSIQIKMSNFSKFSKIKFYDFLIAFIS